MALGLNNTGLWNYVKEMKVKFLGESHALDRKGWVCVM
jgi:hypothetical protein